MFSSGLFYNSELLEIYNRPDQGISAIGFVDDINILIYRKSTEENTRKLEHIHKDYIKYTYKYGAIFEPFKYKLIHFIRQPK